MNGSKQADILVKNTSSHLLSCEEKANIIEEAIRSSDDYGMHGMMTIIAFACARELLVPPVVDALKIYFKEQLHDKDLVGSYISAFTKGLRVDEYAPLRELLEWLLLTGSESSEI